MLVGPQGTTRSKSFVPKARVNGPPWPVRQAARRHRFRSGSAPTVPACPTPWLPRVCKSTKAQWWSAQSRVENRSALHLSWVSWFKKTGRSTEEEQTLHQLWAKPHLVSLCMGFSSVVLLGNGRANRHIRPPVQVALRFGLQHQEGRPRRNPVEGHRKRSALSNSGSPAWM